MKRPAKFILLLSVICLSFISSGEEPDLAIIKIHNKALTVDTHCDTPMLMIERNFDVGVKHTAPDSRVDFIRMLEGGVDAMFFAAFTSQRERTPENTENAYRTATQMIDAVYTACEKYNNLAEVAVTSEDATQIEKLGKRAIYIGMENGFPIGTDINRVNEFYNRGVRYITLCHSSNNEICDSSTDKKGAEFKGLSKFGKKVVKEMNKLGIMVDVSHISDESFFDVIKTTKTPVIASHSSVRSIAHHKRNMSDDMIEALAKNGGVIQICLLDDYIKDPDTTTVYYQKRRELEQIYQAGYNTMTDEEKSRLSERWRNLSIEYPQPLPTVSDCVDHIDYVKNLVGIDYVGIGSDFDGGGGLEDCADVSQFPNITAEMIKRGYSEDDIIKVWGGNFFRVFKAVEDAAKRRM